MGKPHTDSGDPRSKRPQRRGSPKPKFVEQRNEEVQARPLRPLNEKQRKYIDSIENHAMVVATGWAGTSKAQPLHSAVLTATGWKKMRDMVVGEQVVTPDNEIANVLEVHKFARKPVYKFTLKSGRVVESCEDHLWVARACSRANRRVAAERGVFSTNEIISMINSGFNVSLPLCGRIGHNDHKEYFIPPYLMGILIAEGCFSNGVSFSSGDVEIVDKFEKWAAGCGLTIVKIGQFDYAIRDGGSGKTNRVVEEIKRLGLRGKKSQDKFVPEEYIGGSIQQRIELLQGLMDGDGGAATSRRKNSQNIGYSTASEKLCDQLQELVFSLGGYARKSKRPTSYTYKGEKLDGMPSYRLYLSHPTPKIFFQLPRKLAVTSEAYQGGKYDLMDRIVGVERMEDQEVWCILVDSEQHLYLTDNYVVTHNTYIPTVLACQKLRTHQIDKIVFTRPNISNSKSLGFFGGDLIEKMQNWLMPVMNILREQFNEETLEIYLKRGQIEFVPMEVVKGYSAENCFFIVDEAEDLTIDEAKKIVTRQGKGCKMVLCGDVFQSELGSKSGLAWIAEMVKKYPNLNTGLIEFDHVNDIVRSDTCRNWIIALRKEGHFSK